MQERDEPQWTCSSRPGRDGREWGHGRILGSKAALTPEAQRAKPQGRQVGKWDSTGASLDLKKWGHQVQRAQEQRLRQARAETWDIALVLKGERP